MQTNKSTTANRSDGKKPVVDPYFGEERADEGSDLGAIMVHQNVMAVIARIAAMKVPGVAEMSGSFTDGLANIIGRNSGEKGVRVEMREKKVDLEISLVVEYGAKIPQVAWKVQNEVRRAVEDMTGKQVGAINVVVQGVKLPVETKSAAG